MKVTGSGISPFDITFSNKWTYDNFLSAVMAFLKNKHLGHCLNEDTPKNKVYTTFVSSTESYTLNYADFKKSLLNVGINNECAAFITILISG